MIRLEMGSTRRVAVGVLLVVCVVVGVGWFVEGLSIHDPYRCSHSVYRDRLVEGKESWCHDLVVILGGNEGTSCRGAAEGSTTCWVDLPAQSIRVFCTVSHTTHQLEIGSLGAEAPSRTEPCDDLRGPVFVSDTAFARLDSPLNTSFLPHLFGMWGRGVFGALAGEMDVLVLGDPSGVTEFRDVFGKGANRVRVLGEKQTGARYCWSGQTLQAPNRREDQRRWQKRCSAYGAFFDFQKWFVGALHTVSSYARPEGRVLIAYGVGHEDVANVIAAGLGPGAQVETYAVDEKPLIDAIRRGGGATGLVLVGEPRTLELVFLASPLTVVIDVLTGAERLAARAAAIRWLDHEYVPLLRQPGRESQLVEDIKGILMTSKLWQTAIVAPNLNMGKGSSRTRQGRSVSQRPRTTAFTSRLRRRN
mmetsp:Transcript_16670/g.47067  ORF Transcript_16670/g.47067 Transcript_16670/m.47067 type:complete len:418 (+) Transcript_16670:165-1418(+)